MIKALISDFSRVLLFPKDDSYLGSLNALHKELSAHGNYNFWEYFRVNQDLLAFYKTINEHTTLFMFTSEFIQEHPALQPILEGLFSRTFSGARLGLKKTNPQSYITISQEIGLNPEEIIYIDDNQINIDTAQKAGLAVIHYKSTEQTKKDIGTALKIF